MGIYDGECKECHCYRGIIMRVSNRVYSRMRARNRWRVSLQILQLPTNPNVERPFLSVTGVVAGNEASGWRLWG